MKPVESLAAAKLELKDVHAVNTCGAIDKLFECPDNQGRRNLVSSFFCADIIRDGFDWKASIKLKG
jgi:hypothetical protein